ncbi:MAG: hypothetical protein KVP17_002959 [Porospora cf. gigantea B]|uniref:uncharacterized protein n=2 Tax=Porospora cf. gigantea B TaxID=2853592 RepID=UPI0035718519|nr:MAG: hypothetical protein KVP17_002959 [Porospora cf. gigantea B]
MRFQNDRQHLASRLYLGRNKHWNINKTPMAVLDIETEAPAVLKEILAGKESRVIHTLILPEGMDLGHPAVSKKFEAAPKRQFNLPLGSLPITPKKSYILDVNKSIAAQRTLPESYEQLPPIQRKINYTRAQCVPYEVVQVSEAIGRSAKQFRSRRD